MNRFILNSLKKMLNYTLLSLLFLYALICWIITDIGYTQKGFMSTRIILEYYSMVFLSLAAINSMYFIISHFRETLNSLSRDIIIVRIGKYKFFWGLIACYFIYLMFFNLIPLWLTAFIQDAVYNGIHISLSEYYFSIFRIITWTGIWPIILSVILIVWIKNDLLTLLCWSAFYMVIAGINMLSEQYITGNGDASLSYLPVILNILLSFITLFIAVHINRRIALYEYNEKISAGIFSAAAGAMGFDLAMFHYKMMGFKSQVLYLIFGSIGFFFIFAIFSRLSADYLVLSKMFIAVIFPLLFSFNQYSLISIDLESGMITANMLKKVSYDKIVLSRWFSMLIPQILFSIIFSLVLMNMAPAIPISFFVLAVFLNLLFSSMNFFLAVYFNRSGYANFIVGFFAYLMLREDVQKLISENKVLNHINIFETIVSFSNHIPELAQIMATFCVTFTMFFLSRKRLRLIHRYSSN